MAGRFRRKPRGRRRQGRNVQVSRKPRCKRNQGYMAAKKRKKREFSEGSDSSDEDFVLDEEEEEDDDIESTSSEELNESDDEEEAQSTESEDSEEERNLQKPRRNLMQRQKSYGNGKARPLKTKPTSQSIKRMKRSHSDDDEDFDPDFSSATEDDDSVDDDNEGEEIIKSRKTKKTRVKSSSSSTQKLKKRKKSTASSKKLVQVEKKSRPVTKRRRTIAMSEKLIRSTASAGSESDEDFVVAPTRKTKHQEKSSQGADTGWVCPRRGKLNNCSRKLDSSSDSDISFSDSDADYTIVEDGEPSCRSHSFTKSANRSLRASSVDKQEIVSCFKERLEKKRKNISDSDISRSEEGLRKKGKEKIVESINLKDSDLPKPVCGICLSDEGKAIRGKLDCCDHYFCFACIMEWAKVESRCPMCKQRLTMISKSSTSGKGLRGTAIKIPVRDQVYQPSEEEVMGFLDPYADIVCLECHEAGDDGLLLLCDLCDSAYHTYCVGLGRAVPEGDWYCQVCQTSRPAQNNTEEEEIDDFVLDLHNEDDGLTIRELVEDTPIRGCAERINLDLSLSPPSSSVFVRDTTPSRLRTMRRRIYRRSAPNPSPRLSDPARASVRQTHLFGATTQVSAAGARTLSGQRMLQERIHVLHDNWSAQERASQQLSPGIFPGSNSGIDDVANATVLPIGNNHSCLSHESARTSNLDSSVGLEHGLRKSDIDQAWSMMEKSRTLGGDDVQTNDFLRGGRYLQGSSSAQSKDDFSDLMGNARTGLKLCSSSPSGAQSKTKNCRGRLHPESINCRNHSQRTSEEGSCKGIGNHMLSATDVPNRRSSPNLVERVENSRICLKKSVVSDSKPPGNELRKVEGAKDQVRTLVKAHIKQMIAGREVDKLVFKEMARSCTHTILAACGIEHSSHMVIPFERVSCCHIGQSQSSVLMPSCCSHCFNSFVQDFIGKRLQQTLGINVQTVLDQLVHPSH